MSGFAHFTKIWRRQGTRFDSVSHPEEVNRDSDLSVEVGGFGFNSCFSGRICCEAATKRGEAANPKSESRNPKELL